MKLLRYTLPLFASCLLQISCGSSAKIPENNPDDASQFTDVKAPEYFIVKVSGKEDISFRESMTMASEDSLLPDFDTASTLSDLTNLESKAVLSEQTGFSYGRDSASCYRENYQNCNPVYQQGRHNVSYGYAGSYNQGNNTYLSYQRQNLSYYHGRGNIRSYYYPAFTGNMWGGRIGPLPGVYPRPGQYPTYPGNGGPGNGGYPGNGVNIQELRQVVDNLSFKGAPNLPPRVRAESQLGRRLFFDTRFSANNKVACVSCHLPSKSFTDGRRVAIGVGVGKLNTPMNVNRYWSKWQFWDGRATHLASQALAPIESPVEHGSSRYKVAKVLFTDPSYRSLYQELFGRFPAGIEEIERFDAEAAPLKKRELPTYLNDWCYDTMEKENGSLRYPGERYDAARDSYFRPNTDENIARNWNNLSPRLRQAINRVFYNFGVALGSYQKGLVAIDSPFDQFARKLLQTNNITASFNQKFGQRELQGLQYFYKQGGCISCHYGSNFTDEKFHNISLGPNRAYVFLGRAKGVVDAVNDPFSC